MNLDSTAFRVAAWLGIALLVAASAYLAVSGNWDGSLTMAGFAVGSIIAVLSRSRLPSSFSLLFVLASLTNAAGWVWNLFRNRKVIWYDEVVHGFTMCTIGLALGFWIHYARTKPERARARRAHPGAPFVATVTVAALLIGGAWELIEWAFNIIGSTWDTFMDLLMDTAGGLIAGALAVWAIKTNPPRQLRD